MEEEKQKPTEWQRTTTRRVFRRIFSLRALIALAWVVSIIALFYGVYDWHGRQMWNAFRKDYEAQVASLDLGSYFPASIPDAENFAANPVAVSWMDRDNTNALFSTDTWSKADNLVEEQKDPHGLRQFADLAAYEEAFEAVRSNTTNQHQHIHTDKMDLASRAQAAPAVLEGMKDDDAAFDVLRTASAKPKSRYPVNYDLENPWGILLPHLAKIKQSVIRLHIRADAELALGKSEDATADLNLALYLADSANSEPFLIEYLVRIACVRIITESIWEGLAEHRWTDPQLAQFETRFFAYHWLKDSEWPLHGEGAGGVFLIDSLNKKGLGFIADLGETGPTEPAVFRDKSLMNMVGFFLPRGWYDIEKIRYLQAHDRENGNLALPDKRAFIADFNDTINSINENLNDVMNSYGALPSRRTGVWRAITHHEVMSTLLLSYIDRVPIKAICEQVDSDEAGIACALERYRLANRKFPDTLDALIPKFAPSLPNDPINGLPYKYRTTDDGQFVLYSVGWNEKDDGGVPGKKMFDMLDGDWVWEYPPAK